jgi:hypothetical protein
LSQRSLTQLAKATTWSTALWGGRFNPVIPLHDAELARNLVRTFAVDLLMPIEPDGETERFKKDFPHLLTPPFWGERVFERNHCNFVDVRHAVRRISEHIRSRVNADPPKIVRLSWGPTDPLSALLHVLFGKYPEPTEVGIKYAAGSAASLKTEELRIEPNAELDTVLLNSLSPLDLTRFEINLDRGAWSGWLGPGFVLGNAEDLDDLVLLWNLRAAGAKVLFFDPARATRLQSYLGAFLDSLKLLATAGPARINIWSRSEQFESSLDLAGLEHTRSHDHIEIWNGLNVRPPSVRFSLWHRNVVTNYDESHGAAVASFALPSQPFDEDDPDSHHQHFVVTVEASQYDSAPDDLTFSTPFLPSLNEFFGRNFHFDYAGARSARGSIAGGAVGIFETVGKQQLSVRAFHVQDFIRTLFGSLGVEVTRSDPPGLLCARLIRQLGGVQGCRVLKVRGARELIEEYGPDQSFTRGGAEMLIGNIDPNTGKPRFSEFENLYVEPRGSDKLRPSGVFDYLVSCGVFRVGLELKCPNCELKSWIPLDDVRMLSSCAYCGHHFDVTRQLKDRDWRYRRSGLSGRDDHQEGSIPVALTIQQLDTALRDHLLMYSTALKFRPSDANIEECEADFLGVVAGMDGLDESPVQIVLGEAKTRKEIDADDARKLGKLADAIPRGVAASYIMFSKTDTFSREEIQIAKSLNSQFKHRVILWSRDELEPYFVYERSKDRLEGRPNAITLSEMVNITAKLWF